MTTPVPIPDLMHNLLPPIYPITDKALARKPNHFEILKELARGGARLVQVRDKLTPLPQLLPDLFRCVEFSAHHGITLLIDDRCDLVLSVGASGVHLGQEDLHPREARLLLGTKKVIGFSTHTLRQVQCAQEYPVQYLGFGPVFATATKSNKVRPRGLTELRQACERSDLPMVAIGGIVLERVGAVLDAGAASAAVISDLMCAESIAHRMELFLKATMAKR